MIDKLKIGGITYSVTIEPALADSGFSGQIRYQQCGIALGKDMHQTAAAQTLWHEAVHGILHQAGIRKQPEAIIEAMAYGILQVIRENPEFVEMCRGE